ncbi:MAG: hypothetical protein CVU39_25980 [Chloroflexi bacterium HGW-Chloroflexi-10]|nr:MAG: hypothetical protein CVU39_25980 [Chloroflexi bacterium HGW-Chloroflexi-10]
MRSIFRLFSFLLIITILFNPLISWVGRAQAQTPQTVKAIIDAHDQSALNLAKAQGGISLVDYGGFSLWSVPVEGISRLAGMSSISVPVDMDRIYLRGDQLIDGQSGTEPAMAAANRQTRIESAQLWMVQFAGPIKDEWLEELAVLGLQPVIYMPNNAYVVWGDGESLARLDAAVQKGLPFQWAGAYHPQYRLSPALSSLAAGGKSDFVDVTVQFYNTKTTQESMQKLLALGGSVYKSPEEILAFTNISLQVPADQLSEIAAWPEVFNVEPWSAPELLDEVQNMIMTGQVYTSGSNVLPSAPGYLAWLASNGFPTTPSSYPVVDVVDDGLDQGNAANLVHPDFHELGLSANPDRVSYIGNCTADALGDGQGGHGNLNAGIVGSYNDLTGSPYVDANGYNIGLGVSPYGRIASTKIFLNSGNYDASYCSNTDVGVVAASYNAGADFTTNSWGADVGGAYDSSSQAYDVLTRDASLTTTGSQQMLHIFSAGNAGSGANTIGSPGTAKNVLTVGATENVRDEGVVDRLCGESNANSADDIAVFSSRGPTDDQRVKPDIMAPGTHVQGPASQAVGYNGSGVCGFGDISPYNYPTGQSLYTWSSGTSHSTPAVAGAASLIYEYYGRVLNPGQEPSPAMIKAMLLNSPRYLDGIGTAGTLPSNNQGWGDVNLGMLFDGTPRQVYDQRAMDVLTATGEIRNFVGSIPQEDQPFRVTLVWTDAPGSTTGSSYINDLNLEVIIAGNTYKGNVFSGENSTTGGTADPRNNVENVYLPAGVSGDFIVRVTAANIAGDGLPGNADITDQDFALVISNAQTVSYAVLEAAGNTLTQVTGNGDAVVDPGEVYDLLIPLSNAGGAQALDVNGTLSLLNSGAVITQPFSAYPDINMGAAENNTVLYRFTVNSDQVCGESLSFRLAVAYDTSKTLIYNFSVDVGLLVIGTPLSFVSGDVPKAIPDNNEAGVNSTVTVPTQGMVGDVDVTIVNLTHTYDGDLVFKLTSPDATQVTLISHRGGSGNNYTNTVLDDSAANPISSGTAPFTGSFRPESPLSILNAESMNGVWTLNVSDNANLDTGTLTSWSLTIASQSFVCYTGPNHAPVLNTINDQSVAEGNLLSFMASASDEDLTQTLTFSLDPGAPLGAAINPGTGEFTWTPSEAQGPGEYPITVRVTDNAASTLSDTQTFTVSVTEVNTAPQLTAISNKTVKTGNLLTFSASASDADLPANSLTFSLDPGAPAGVAINPATGVFTWTPSQAQGPAEYSITVRVTDNGAGSLSDTQTFSVTVLQAFDIYLPLLLAQ